MKEAENWDPSFAPELGYLAQLGVSNFWRDSKYLGIAWAKLEVEKPEGKEKLNRIKVRDIVEPTLYCLFAVDNRHLSVTLPTPTLEYSSIAL